MDTDPAATILGLTLIIASAATLILTPVIIFLHEFFTRSDHTRA